MPDFDVNRYAEAWTKHVKVRGDDAQAYVAALVDFYTEGATYTDVPSGHRFAGHSGLEEMSRYVSSAFDADIEVLWTVADDSHFAIEYETVVRLHGNEVKVRGVAAGEVYDGRVSAHRDYYDRSALNGPSRG
jgi:limonene-1,2-epoxide hydrolase